MRPPDSDVAGSRLHGWPASTWSPCMPLGGDGGPTAPSGMSEDDVGSRRARCAQPDEVLSRRYRAGALDHRMYVGLTTWARWRRTAAARSHRQLDVRLSCRVQIEATANSARGMRDRPRLLETHSRGCIGSPSVVGSTRCLRSSHVGSHSVSGREPLPPRRTWPFAGRDQPDTSKCNKKSGAVLPHHPELARPTAHGEPFIVELVAATNQDWTLGRLDPRHVPS